jgi:hypothetical protein
MAGGAQFLGDGVCLLLLKVEQRHIHSVRRETACGLRADPLGGACHYRDWLIACHCQLLLSLGLKR